MASSLIPVINADHMQLDSLIGDQLNEAPVNFLLDEMILEIFSHLNLQELAQCRLISRKFSTFANNDTLVLKKILQHMKPFRKEEWETYFGEVGKEPPLPKLKVLKEIYKTYILVLMPETVDSKPLTLNLFKTLAENPKGGGYVTKIFSWDKIIAQHGEVANVSSKWVLFPKNLLEGTRGKAYTNQIKIVAAKKGKDFEIPHMLDAMVSLASRHVQLSERLFIDCFTRCQETVYVDTDDDNFEMIVGYLEEDLCYDLCVMYQGDYYEDLDDSDEDVFGGANDIGVAPVFCK